MGSEGSARTRRSDSSELESEWPVGGLGTNQSATFTANVRHPGARTLRAVADPTHVIEESLESNNEKTFSLLGRILPPGITPARCGLLTRVSHRLRRETPYRPQWVE